MKVLALNSGPRATAESYTSLMLNHLVEGMKEEGADVEVIQLRTKKIRNCIGCFTCWTKTPGKCVHKDDMTNELFPKFLASDLGIYASPLYFHTVNAQMPPSLDARFRRPCLFSKRTKTESPTTPCALKPLPA